MTRQELLYEGKAKRLYRTEDEQVLWVEYKNDATAFNGKKKASLDGKAELNNEITSLIFTVLEERGIPSHFIKRLSATEQLVKAVTIVPLEVVMRNVVAGSLARRLGLEEGTPLKEPIIEFYYKNDDLDDPLVTEDHIALLDVATREECQQLRTMALHINEVLKALFAELGVDLIDGKVEFGRGADGSLLLADEISPDTCRLWDHATGERLDKDLFRRDLGNLQAGYQNILSRLRGAHA